MGSGGIRRLATSIRERSSDDRSTKHRQLNPRVYETGASPVQLVMEHLADGGGGPALAAAPRWGHAGVVEVLGDARDPPALGRSLEDLVHRRGLSRVYHPSCRRAMGPAAHAQDAGPHIVIAIDLPAGHIAAAGQTQHCVIRALLCPFPLHL